MLLYGLFRLAGAWVCFPVQQVYGVNLQAVAAIFDTAGQSEGMMAAYSRRSITGTLQPVPPSPNCSRQALHLPPARPSGVLETPTACSDWDRDASHEHPAESNCTGRVVLCIEGARQCSRCHRTQSCPCATGWVAHAPSRCKPPESPFWQRCSRRRLAGQQGCC
jgi:hypothetical protein